MANTNMTGWARAYTDPAAIRTNLTSPVESIHSRVAIGSSQYMAQANADLSGEVVDTALSTGLSKMFEGLAEAHGKGMKAIGEMASKMA